VIEEKIDELKAKIIDYSAIVTSMVINSIRALVDKREDILRIVLNKDEPRANEKEIEIDEMCLTFIVQLQPKAVDLRTILMVLKMNNDLERIGDHAVNISQSVSELIKHPLAKPLIDITKMADEVIQMLNDSVQAFVHEDAGLAKDVCERDIVVDKIRNQTVRELITYMASDPKTIEQALHLMRISKNLERIADLSTNICEEVIYLVDGRVIKHHHPS
jgi:phosphate transport system protein